MCLLLDSLQHNWRRLMHSAHNSKHVAFTHLSQLDSEHLHADIRIYTREHGAGPILLHQPAVATLDFTPALSRCTIDAGSTVLVHDRPAAAASQQRCTVVPPCASVEGNVLARVLCVVGALEGHFTDTCVAPVQLFCSPPTDS